MSYRRFDLTSVDTEGFLDALGVRNVERQGEYYKFSCPFAGHSHGDLTPSAQMRDSDTVFHCFGCKRGGNAITFLAEHEGVDYMQARRWLREEFGGDFVEPEGGAILTEWNEHFREREHATEPERGLVVLEEETAEVFSVDWRDARAQVDAGSDDPVLRYMFDRGYPVEVLERWGIGFDPASWGGGRFTIPVRDERGLLVGFKGRSWDPETKPKYLYIGDKPEGARYGWPLFDKSDVLFALDRVPEDADTAILLEGELDVIAMHEMGHTNAVGLAGSSLSDRQCRLLVDRFERAVVFMDSDLAGDQATHGYVRPDGGRRHVGIDERLEGFMPVRNAPDHEGDPDSMSPDEVAWCLANTVSSLADTERAARTQRLTDEAHRERVEAAS